MDIKHIHETNKGVFSVEEKNEVLAKLEYSMAGEDKMIISHTEVNPILSGKGVGKQLVAKAVDYAREHKIKILPLCPFAKAIFDKVPEYNDVLF